MNNSIKEILDKFSNRKQGTLLQAIRELKEQDVKHACVTTEENINKLLNYITNLQKENENLLYEINGYLKEKEELKEKINKLEDYKQRNEKAIECIKNIDYFEGEISDDIENIPFKYVMDTDIDELLNILQGGDE